MRLRITHLVRVGTNGRRPPDGVGRTDDDRAFFVPGWLPCGECGRCRRGWVAACAQGRAPLAHGEATVDLDERFLTALDEPTGVAPLDPALAACAGVIAETQELSARAGLGAGDLAVWIGDDVRCTLGARLTAARGVTTFRWSAEGDPGHAKVLPLNPTESAQAWNEALAAASSAASGGFQERRLFVASAAPALLAVAGALTAPGTTLALFDGSGGGAIDPVVLAPGRALVAAGRGYHPDLVPEALASLRRDPELTSGLVVASATVSSTQLALTILPA